MEGMGCITECYSDLGQAFDPICESRLCHYLDDVDQGGCFEDGCCAGRCCC